MSETNSKQKFEEALSLLNEAAKEKKEDIQRLLSDRYSHISLLRETYVARGADWESGK